MLEVVLAELAEPERLRRGRRYARQGAVMNLSVEAGAVCASVQGSRSAPYDVEIRLTREGRAPETVRLADLVPKASSLRFDCSCPDWEEPCKHAVAVMTELAERVAYDPTLLGTWRGTSTEPIEDLEDDTPATREESVDRTTLDAFLGTARTIDVPAPALTALPHVQVSWDEPWSGMLHDALRVLSRR
jgi:uncharacterized Zn finger protein